MKKNLFHLISISKIPATKRQYSAAAKQNAKQTKNFDKGMNIEQPTHFNEFQKKKNNQLSKNINIFLTK